MIDVAFNKFLTLKIIKIVWVVSIVAAVLTALGGIAYGLLIGSVSPPTFDEANNITAEGTSGPNWLLVILSPILAALWLLFVRIALELVAVVFKIADSTAAMAHGLASAQPPLRSVSPPYEESS